MNAPAIGVTALFALAAMLGLLGPGTALAQNPEAKARTKT